MKILITGAEGQLGRALCDLVKGAIPLSRKQLDITDLPQIERALSQHQPDAVINTAAYNLVDRAESEPETAMAVNKTGPENLAKATAAQNIPFIHVSTDYVFDGTKESPYVESDWPHPLSIYAKSKLAGEEAVLAVNARAIVARTSWVYSPGGKNFLLTMYALRERPVLKVVHDQQGSPTFAPHLAQALISMLEKKTIPGLYHVAGSGQTNWFDFASLFFKKMNIATPLKPISSSEYPYTAQRPRYTVLSTEKKPSFMLPPWEQGLDEFVKILKSHGM